jgi:hypothetical protein
MSDKIINTFQQRRQLEQAFSELATTASDLELREAAKRIVHTFPAAGVLAALLKRLDSPSGQVRGGLGHIAGLLDPDEVLPALRNVAANRGLTPQARLTAASIAHRYIGTELPHVLLADLTDTEEIAFQSLREALDEARHNRHVLLEYVTQMQEHPEAIAWMVMGMVERVVPEERVELLRLIAQDQRLAVAKGALSQLESLALAGTADAARALHTLHFALTGDLAAQAERSERKARFGGQAYTPPTTDGWRALLSSADPNGGQSVWLLRAPVAAAVDGVLLGFAHNELLGLTHFFGTETLDKTLLPQPAPVGSLVTVTMDSGHTAAMLEVPFDYGRWLLQQALARRQTLHPEEDRTGEYKLYNDLIWQFAAPSSTDAAWPRWQYQLPTTAAPAASLSAVELTALTERLFQHPVMEHWQLHNSALLPAGQRDLLPQQELVMALLKQMERGTDGAQLSLALTAGLRVQASWLYLAGEQALAEQCATLALQLARLPITQNPVLAYMLGGALAREQEKP